MNNWNFTLFKNVWTGECPIVCSQDYPTIAQTYPFSIQFLHKTADLFGLSITHFFKYAGQDINACLGQVVLYAGQIDRPKYLPDRTSKLKLFVISWHFNLRVIFPRLLSGSLLKDWNQLYMLNAWANHSMRYQCLRLFSQCKVDCGWLVNVTWSWKFQSMSLHPLFLHVLVFHK